MSDDAEVVRDSTCLGEVATCATIFRPTIIELNEARSIKFLHAIKDGEQERERRRSEQEHRSRDPIILTSRFVSSDVSVPFPAGTVFVSFTSF